MSDDATYEETLKPAAVEAPIDRFFFRPVAYQLVRVALLTPLSANVVTAASVLIGLAGASLLRFPHRTELVAGALLLFLHAILDRADGQLARARGASSRLGRILDGMSDYIVGIACAVTIALHFSRTETFGGVWLAVLGLGSVMLQGTLADYFENRYLARSDTASREGEELEETEAEIARGGPAGVLFLYRFYALFLLIQHTVAGGKKADRPTDEEAAAYAEDLGPIARGWAYLGASTHAALMLVFVIVGALPAYIWARLTVCNVAMLALVLVQKRRESAVLDRFRPAVQQRAPYPIAPSTPPSAPSSAPPPAAPPVPIAIELPFYDDDVDGKPKAQ